MSSVLKRGDRWYVKFKDANGRWCRQPTTAESKTDAKRLASDLERQAERQRLGLEPLRSDEGTSLGDLLRTVRRMTGLAAQVHVAPWE